GVAGAMSVEWLDRRPGDVIAGVCVIVGIGAVRLARRSRLYRLAFGVAFVDLGTQLLLAILGFALLFDRHAVTRGTSLGTTPTWHAIAFALPLAMLAYTGLETVANLAEEAREPGVDLPRSLFSAIGLVVAIYVAIALVGLSAFPPRGGTTELGTTWLRSPLMGIVAALQPHLPDWAGGTLRVYVGL